MSAPAMPVATETAVIVPVGPAEAVVAEHRQRLDPAASWGVPAHVTVLYPFVPPGSVDDDVVARLASTVASTRAFTCTFGACRWFGDEVLWLAPNPAQPFRDLTDAVVRHFPDFPPYGGEFDEVVPHLTVGESRDGATADLEAVEVEVRSRLPVTARVDHALLMAGTDQPGAWHVVAELPLG